MKILVTGGGGFLGRRITEMLLKENYDVRIFNRKDYPEIAKLGVECIVGDLTNYDDVRRACRGCDIVIHTAAKAEIWGDFNSFYEINVRGTRHVVEACVIENVSRLVYTSSPSVVIGSENIENGNEDLHYPLTWYASYPQTKAEAERYVLNSNGRQLLNGKQLYTCALRPHCIWGPGDNHLVPTLIKAVKAGRLCIVGNGKNKIDMTYIDHAAKAHIDILTALGEGGKCNGQAYFIGDSEPVEVWTWLNNLLKEMNLPLVQKKYSAKIVFAIGFICELIWRILDIKKQPLMTRFVAIQLSRSHWFSHEKAKKDFNYQTFISPQKGLKLLLEELNKEMDE